MTPKEWSMKTVHDLCELVSVGIVVKPTQYYTDAHNGIKAFRSANVREGKVNDSNWIYITSMGHLKNSKSRLQTGDVLVVRSGAPGTSCVVTEDYNNTNCIDIVFARPKINKILPQYLSYFTNSSLGKRQVANSEGGLALKHFNVSAYKKMSVMVPPMSEQYIISEILVLWDSATEKMEKLIEAKEKQLRHFASTLLNKAKHTQAHVRNVTSEVSVRNKGQKCQRVLSVTNHSGFILPEEQFERRVASDNLSNYKIVQKHQYAYNPSRINVGSIARLDAWDKGVLSPMYVVFKLNHKKINNDFFLHWLSSYEAKERIKRSAQGSVRETVSFTDFGAISLSIPALDQQQGIADSLNIVQKEIELLKKLADKYKKQKRGLMQKLLTGQWRVKI